MENNIWITGPIELLNHGIKHINQGNDFDLRIAMISIDNAVEATLKTFLILNRRSLGINFKKYKSSIKNFPKILDLLLIHSSDKISVDELDAIEMFHMIRNNLYHQGTGITVNKNIVESYSVVAKELISRLFDVKEGENFEIEASTDINRLYSEFLTAWRDIEINLKNLALTQDLIPQTQRPLNFRNILTTMYRNELIDDQLANDISYMHSFKNKIVHSHRNYNIEEMNELINNLYELKEKVLKLIQEV